MSSEDMVHGRKRPNHLLAVTAETRRGVQSLKETAGLVSERSQKQKRGHDLGKIVRLLSQQSLAECSSISGKVEW